MKLIIIYLIGVFVGALVVNLFKSRKLVGTLRIDSSDPECGPRFFLEINRGCYEKIQKSRVIHLAVNHESYIPQK